MTDNPARGNLHLTLYLVNGSQKQFIQADPIAAQSILDQLRPERLFTQKQLLIAGDEVVTIIPLEDIERVDLRSDPLPHWPHNERITSVNEVTEEDFQRIRRREPVSLPAGRTMPLTPPLQVGILVELRSGAVIYLSVFPSRPGVGDTAPEATTPEDTRFFFQHLFTRPVLFGNLDDNQGIFLLNPANAVHFTLTPSPPEPSAGAWQMQMVADK